MRILVLSDTHIPRVANDLPAAIYDEIKNVDMILHAGDFVDKNLYDKLSGLKPLKAVLGNMDSADLRGILNEKEILDVEKVRIGLIHGHGAPRELIDTVIGEFKNVDAIVFGHSHSALNTVKDGVLLFNPGSVTDNIFAAYNSYGILEISGNKVEGKIVKL
jgi:hypothetical protein